MSVLRQHLPRAVPLFAIAIIAAAGPPPLCSTIATTADPGIRDEAGWLGVSVQEISDGIREATGLDTDGGILVNEVLAGSPAEESGLETGDVILALDGTDVQGLNEVIQRVRAGHPGDAIDLTLLRDGRELTVTAELGERPEEEEREVLKFFGEDGPHTLAFHGPTASAHCNRGLAGSRIAVRVQDLNPQLSEALGVQNDQGALVIEADEDGPAFAAGIRGGDVIVRVDGQPVADTAELRSLIQETEPGTEVNVTVLRNRKEKTFPVIVEEGPLSSIRKRIEIRTDDLKDALEGLDLEDLGEIDGLAALKDLHIDIESDVRERLADLQAQLEDLRTQLEKVRKRQR